MCCKSKLWPRDQHIWSDMLNYVACERKHKVKSGLHHFPILLFSPSSPAVYSLLSIKWSNHAISWKTRFTNKTFSVHQVQTRLKKHPAQKMITTSQPWACQKCTDDLEHLSLLTFPLATVFTSNVILILNVFFSCSVWYLDCRLGEMTFQYTNLTYTWKYFTYNKQKKKTFE